MQRRGYVYIYRRCVLRLGVVKQTVTGLVILSRHNSMLSSQSQRQLGAARPDQVPSAS